jgi:hypothetical protein
MVSVTRATAVSAQQCANSTANGWDHPCSFAQGRAVFFHFYGVIEMPHLLVRQIMTGTAQGRTALSRCCLERCQL